jgi:Ca2+-binding RTX toxin-like protein
MAKRRNQLIGTPEKDFLTGTSHKNVVYGRGGDDIISSNAGLYRVWGEAGNDQFVTLNDARGHIKIMDLEIGETIIFCGCPATQIEQRGKDAWIIKGNDVKAIVIDANTSDFLLDFPTRSITLVTDTLV